MQELPLIITQAQSAAHTERENETNTGRTVQKYPHNEEMPKEVQDIREEQKKKSQQDE